MARLQEFYRDKVVPDLIKKFGYKSPMQVPRITKITLNMGVSEAVSDKKVMDHAVGDLTKIAGQKPVVTKSKKAIAGFKIRDGVPIGCMVTLRGVRMYEFLDRFVTIALPRVRDFRGISGARLRRPRQLQHRRQGTDHFSRGRVRQGRCPARPEHQHHDDGEDRRGVQGAPRRVQVSVQELKDQPVAKTFPDPARTEARPTGRQVREEARRAEGDRERRQEVRRRALRRRASSCRSCRATPTRRASAIAAPSPAARAARSASSAWAATRSANWRSRATSPASSRPAGNRREPEEIFE